MQYTHYYSTRAFKGVKSSHHSKQVYQHVYISRQAFNESLEFWNRYTKSASQMFCFRACPIVFHNISHPVSK